MNAQAKIEPTTALSVPANAAAGVVLFDTEKFSAFYAKLKADVDAVPVDLTTDKGRKAIASVAAKVRSEKAGIDRDRKRLTQEWRDMTAQVNGAWNTIKDQLDELAVEARKPLTEWEEAEAARVAEADRLIAEIHIAAIVAPEDSAATIRARGAMVWQIALGADLFGSKLPEARAAKDQSVAILKAALARLIQEEADRAELKRLRDEAAAREEADRIAAEEFARIEAERIAAERAAQEAAERAQAEQERRAAAEQAEAARIEQARQDAAEAAQRQAEQAAQAERERTEREHAEALAAERRRAEDAERARQEDADRIAREEAARQAEADRLAGEQAAREADQAHRTAVKSAAKTAIMTCGVDEDTARKIVTLIIEGEVPNIRMEF